MERERIAKREVGQEGVVDDASTINDGYTAPRVGLREGCRDAVRATAHPMNEARVSR